MFLQLNGTYPAVMSQLLWNGKYPTLIIAYSDALVTLEYANSITSSDVLVGVEPEPYPTNIITDSDILIAAKWKVLYKQYNLQRCPGYC